jgi:ubiquinol-cytochrome c reductase cytochrome c subunit
MTRRYQILACALGAALITAAAPAIVPGAALAQPQSGIVRPTTEPATPSVELGAQLYAGNCASCHGIAGSGITSPRPGAGGILGQGPPLRGVGASAADFYLRTGYMPLSSPHDQPGPDRVLFTGKEIASLVHYVSSLGPGPPVPHPNPAAGSISEGTQLFTLHCAGCHQELARGGFVTGAEVPPLQTVKATQIAEAVRIGPSQMPAFGTAAIPAGQVDDVVAYVRYLDHPDNRGGEPLWDLGPVAEGGVAILLGLAALLLASRWIGSRG